MAKITFEIPDENILAALKKAAGQFDATLKEGTTINDIAAELVSDIETAITHDLTGFFYEGLNCDLYSNVVEGKDSFG